MPTHPRLQGVDGGKGMEGVGGGMGTAQRRTAKHTSESRQAERATHQHSHLCNNTSTAAVQRCADRITVSIVTQRAADHMSV